MTAMNQPDDRPPGALPDEGVRTAGGAAPGDGRTAVPGLRSKPDMERAIRENRRAALVVNTGSRRGQRHYAAVHAKLQAAGFDLIGSFPADRTGGPGASIAAAMELRPDLLIVGGGDGTISEAARRLAYSDMALGVLPLGTTNNFARTLGLPMTVDGAIGVLAGGKVADVDLGRAGDTIFANLVSVGLSGHVSASVPHRLKRVVGRAAYPLTALAALPRHRAFRASITVGGQTHTLTTHQLNIANGSFHAGRPITRDTSADDRLLLVYRLGGPGRPALLGATLRHAVLGARRSLAEPAFLAVGELWLETDPPLPFDVDGEVEGNTPARIALAPQALRVMVDRGFPDT